MEDFEIGQSVVYPAWRHVPAPAGTDGIWEEFTIDPAVLIEREGDQYRIELKDGSKVWVAASELLSTEEWWIRAAEFYVAWPKDEVGKPVAWLRQTQTEEDQR